MKARQPPPSRAEWALSGELDGHSHEQIIGYLSDCADAEDEVQRVRALPALAISPDAEPFPRLRRWFGVGG